jgi:shikimate kinase
MNLILTGFMGTGKSVLGQKLAEKLQLDFIDMDTLIEERAGMSIPEIFSRFGETHFRRLESETVCSLADSKKKVIATGGGTIVDPENLQRLKEIGPVICLTATPETIYNRVRSDSYRPLLQVPDPIGQIHQLLDDREPHYAKADYHIPTDRKTIEELVNKILVLINKSG